MSDVQVFNMQEAYSWRSRGRGDYIGRPSVLGNPYVIGPDGRREVVIERHRADLRTLCRKHGRNLTPEEQAVWDELIRLRDKVLSGEPVSLLCYCKPLPCHGDTIKACIDWLVQLKRKQNEKEPSAQVLKP